MGAYYRSPVTSYSELTNVYWNAWKKNQIHPKIDPIYKDFPTFTSSYYVAGYE